MTRLLSPARPAGRSPPAGAADVRHGDLRKGASLSCGLGFPEYAQVSLWRQLPGCISYFLKQAPQLQDGEGSRSSKRISFSGFDFDADTNNLL